MPPTEGDPPMRSRHPMFYFRDGSVCQVTNTEGSGMVLYRLHLSVLENRSTVFRDIFSLPFGNPLANTGDGAVVQLGRLEEATQGQNSVVLEGQDDEHPFELPAANVTQSKFDHLVTYLYSYDPSAHIQRTTNSSLMSSTSPRFLTSLTVSDTLLNPTFTSGSSLPSGTSSSGIYHITQAKAKLQRLRIGMAFKPPQLAKGPACQTYSACASAWDREWWGELGRYILHPRVRASGTTIKSYTLATDIVGVCRGCRDATVEAMDLKGAVILPLLASTIA